MALTLLENLQWREVEMHSQYINKNFNRILLNCLVVNYLVDEFEEGASEWADGGADDAGGVDQHTVGIPRNIAYSQPLAESEQN
jgi:hypothetical protein